MTVLDVLAHQAQCLKAIMRVAEKSSLRPSWLPTLAEVCRVQSASSVANESLAQSTQLLTISTPHLDVESGVRTAEEIVLMPSNEQPTAVFAANDLLAIGHFCQSLMTSRNGESLRRNTRFVWLRSKRNSRSDVREKNYY